MRGGDKSATDWRGIVTAVLLCPGLALANPLGEAVRHGNVQFERTDHALRVLQGSNKAIIDWDSFSISAGELTEFIQPGSNAAVLNRVRSAAMSRIDGALRANGRVLLINPNGVVVGPTGTVDVAGFIASTLDIPDNQFLAGGDLNFRGNSAAAVVNLGTISAFEGDIFLIANEVRNAGTLSAPNGTVGLAAGKDVLIQEAGQHERVFVRAGNGQAVNTGNIEGAVAELKAYNGNLYGMAVKNEGRVAATGVTRKGGQIFLSANGGKIRNTGTLEARKANGSGGQITIDAGEGGSVEAGGTIDATGESGPGGEVMILGSEIEVLGDALVIADGETGGGSIFIGGGRRGEDPNLMNAENVTVKPGAVLSANALNSGDGGAVIVFAKDTLRFDGSVSARGGPNGGHGGFAELSGQKALYVNDIAGQVDLSAVGGNAGTLLIDPVDVNVVHGTGGGISGSTITDGAINAALETMNVAISTSETGGAEGDITLNGTGDPGGAVGISWITPSILTFNADDDFFMNPGAVIDASGGSGAIEIFASQEFLLGIGSSLMTDDGGIDITSNRIAFDGSGTIQSGSGDIHLITNDFEMLGGSNVVQSSGNLAVAPRTFGTSVGIGDGATGALNLDSAEIASFANGFNSIEIGSERAPAVNIEAVSFDDPVAIVSGDDIFVNGTVTNTEGTISLVQMAPLPGTTYLNGNLVTSGQPITINDSVVLGANVLIDTTNSGLAGAGADVGITGTVIGNGSARDFTIDAGTGGAINLNSEIGGSNLVNHIKFSSGDLTLADAVTAQGDIVFSTNTINFAETVTGSGALTIAPTNPATSIGIGNGAAGTLKLTSAEIALLQNGFSSITIGDEVNGGGAIDIQTITFQDPVTIAAPAAGGSIAVNGELTGSDNASITLNGSGATTTLTANVTTFGNSILINDRVLLGADVRLDTTLGGNSAGADVTVNEAIDSQAATNFSLAALGGTGGTVTFNGGIGIAQPLNELTVEGLAIQLNGGEIITTGAQKFAGPVVLGADTAIDAGNGAVDFDNTVDGPFSLKVDAAGPTTFSGVVGGTTTLTTLEVLGAGPIHLNGGDIFTVGAQTFAGPISLGANTRLDVGSNATVDLESTIDGAFSFQVNTDGSTIFGGAVGGTTALSTVQITGPGITNINGGGIRTTGTQTFSEDVILGADTILDTTNGGNNPAGANVSITSSVTGQTSAQNFTVNAGAAGVLNLGGDVGGANLINHIDFDTFTFDYSGTLTAQGNVDIDTRQHLALNPGASIDVTNGNLTLNANQGAPVAGNFSGIILDSATLTTSGAGNIALQGHGGNDPGTGTHEGIRIGNGSMIVSTATGATAGTITLTGAGGASLFQGRGVHIEGSTIESTDGAIFINGNGNGVGNGADGIFVDVGGVVRSIGTGVNAGPVMLIGNGSAAGLDTAKGVTVSGVGALVTSIDGDISLDGTAGGSGASNHGVDITNGGMVTSSGMADVKLTGTGTAGASDIQVDTAGTAVSSTGGNLEFNGQHVVLDSLISATAGSVTVKIGNGATPIPGSLTVNGGITAGTGLFASGGIGPDTFFINAAVPAAVNYNGDAGSDILDFSGSGAGINLNAASLVSIEEVFGSNQADTLTGPNTATTFAITGADIFSFSGVDVTDFENLTGGPNADVFEIGPAGSLSGVLIGNGPANTLDYSAFGAPVTIDFENRSGPSLRGGLAGGFAGINDFIGSADPTNLFIGPDIPTEFILIGQNNFVLNGGTSATLVSDFPNLLGGAADDIFRFGPGGSLDGTLDGGGGALNGLNYFLFQQPVLVNVETGTATGIGGGFSNINSLGGSLAGNTLIGPSVGTSYRIDGINGFTFNLNGLPFIAAGVENLSGGPGSDNFELIAGGRLDGELRGGGGIGQDRLSYAAFGHGVEVNVDTGDATEFGSIAGFEILMGSNAVDTLATGDGDDTFNILNDNSGNIGNAIRFDSFEKLDAGLGDDRFNFLNLATVNFADGGAGGDDLLFLNLDGPAGSLNIRNERIEFNSTWRFENIERVRIDLGSRNDTATTRFTTFEQNLRGGPGFDTLQIVGNPSVSGNQATGPGKPITFLEFEDLAFIDEPDPPEPPEMADTPDEMEIPDVVDDTGVLLQNQVEQVLVIDDAGSAGAEIPFQNQFTGETLALSQQSMSALQGAFSAAIAGVTQGVFIGVNPDGSGLIIRPFSLDGSGLAPSTFVTEALVEALSPIATLELAEAIGFDMAIFLFNPDGPYAIDLSEGAIDPAVLNQLLASLATDGNLELLTALQMAIVFSLTPPDGPISIGVDDPAPGQGIVLLLNEQLANEAFEELMAALEAGDGAN